MRHDGRVDKLYVPLPLEALEALHRLAVRNLRSQRQQAAYLILQGLKRSEHVAAAQSDPGTKDTGEPGRSRGRLIDVGGGER